MPGIELHASMADSLLSNRFIRAASVARGWRRSWSQRSPSALLSAFLPFAGAAIAPARDRRWLDLVTVERVRPGLWLNLVEPVAAGGIALFAGTAYRYFVEDREKRKVKKLFSRYVSKDVYSELIEHPERAELGVPAGRCPSCSRTSAASPTSASKGNRKRSSAS